MRRVLPVAAALALAATGCSTSEVDPDATVTITGRALDASGRPLPNAEVLLFKQADLGELLVGTTLAIGTLSTICLLPEAPAVCNKARTATTDHDGRYEFELKGSDTQGTLGSEATLSIVFSDGQAQGSTTVSFVAKDTAVGVPDARLWRARPQVPPPGGPVRLSWSPLGDGAGDDVDYAAQVIDTDTGAVLWSQPATGNEAAVDPRVLEDRPASIAVGATAGLPGGSEAGDVRVSYLSARLPVDATAGAPPSRGRACAAVTGPQARLAAPAETCPFTDGDLAAPAQIEGGGNRTVTGAVLDLGSQRPVDLVVARGFAGQFLVELSRDGRTFSPVATELGTTVAVTLPGAPSARYVRVRSATGLDQSLAAEISVW